MKHTVQIECPRQGGLRLGVEWGWGGSGKAIVKNEYAV